MNVRATFGELIDRLFVPQERPRAAIAAACWIGGVFFWLLFFNFGRTALTGFDWPKEIAYLSVLKEAMTHGYFPWETDVAFQGTTKFLALPETCLSPQILLLLHVGVIEFLLIDQVALFTVGFAGCYALARRFRLSIWSFMLLFLLVNFNGYLTSRMNVGHRMWLSYYYFPWFLFYLVKLMGEERRQSACIGLVVTLTLMLAQGGVHLFIWSLLCLGLILLGNPKLVRPVAIVFVATVLVSAYRIVPAAFEFRTYGEPFVSGYPSVGTLVDALVTLRPVATPGMGGMLGIMGWWEYNLYVGLAGATLLAVGAWWYLQSVRSGVERTYRGLWVALAVLTLMALGDVYSVISRLPVPFANFERASSRFITLPFVFFILVGAVGLSRFGMVCSRRMRLVLLLLAGACCVEVVRHGRAWKLIPDRTGQITHASAVRLVPNADNGYHQVVVIGLGLTIVTVVGAGAYLARTSSPMRRTQRLPVKPPTAYGI